MIKITQSRDDRGQFAQLLCFYCANLKCFNEKKILEYLFSSIYKENDFNFLDCIFHSLGM